MHQIRIHGRGGQGVVTAAELLAIAAFNNNWQAQAFPSFGVERTGAPIVAFVRLDDKAIRTREQIQNPDILIVQDASLLSVIDVTQGCSPETKIIVNTSQKKEKLNIKLSQENIYVIDATKIALEILGKNIVNTVILGTFAHATKLITIESLEIAIKQKFAGKDKKLINDNIKAVREAYK